MWVWEGGGGLLGGSFGVLYLEITREDPIACSKGMTIYRYNILFCPCRICNIIPRICKTIFMMCKIILMTCKKEMGRAQL